MSKIKVMVNGLPGNVASALTRPFLRDERFEVVPYSLTGPEITAHEYVVDGLTIYLVSPGERNEIITDVIRREGPFICVDFTHPSAVNRNAEFYCHNKIPFVMGTTGGDREQLARTVTASAITAVIAPNMAKQIVGLQAMVEYAANTFPGLFDDYSLEVRESHQKGKADTSGTAKAMVQYFNRLGCEFSESQIVMERDPGAQKNIWGVPDEYLKGHAWHTYTLVSPDGTARFSLTHNINGRDIYAHGTMDAVIYLAGKMANGVRGEIFTMIDVMMGR